MLSTAYCVLRGRCSLVYWSNFGSLPVMMTIKGEDHWEMTIGDFDAPEMLHTETSSLALSNEQITAQQDEHCWV